MDDFLEKNVEIDGVWFAKCYVTQEHLERVKHFETTDSDVFILSYPKCGKNPETKCSN